MSSSEPSVPSDHEPSEAEQDVLLEGLLESLQAGATLKDLQGVSDEMMEGVYSFAHQFYCDGRLEQAETFFRFLCLYDVHNSEYALGLAAVCQLQGRHQQALDLYALAFTLSHNDYRPMLHAGQCQLALGKLAQARECYAVVVTHAAEEDLRLRAQAYLDAIATVQSGVEETDELSPESLTENNQ